MSLAPDRTTTLALIGLTIAATLSGCNRGRTERPFDDVTAAERNESTLAAEPGEAAATQEAPAPVVADTSVAQPLPEVTQDQTTVPPTIPPSRQPTVVPPTETIRAETPTAAGPATTSAVAGPGRYHIVADSPAIVPTTRPVSGNTVATGPQIPIEIDEVGLVRQWPLWIGERPSGNVIAGPHYWPTITREPRRTELNQGFIEPVEFLWNTLLLPYRMVRTPPWTAVTYDPARDQDEPRAPYEINEAAQQGQQQGQQQEQD